MTDLDLFYKLAEKNGIDLKPKPMPETQDPSLPTPEERASALEAGLLAMMEVI